MLLDQSVFMFVDKSCGQVFGLREVNGSRHANITDPKDWNSVVGKFVALERKPCLDVGQIFEWADLPLLRHIPQPFDAGGLHGGVGVQACRFAFFLFLQYGFFGGVQNAVQSPEDREGQNHLAVIGLLVVASQKLCDGPDEGRQVVCVNATVLCRLRFSTCVSQLADDHRDGKSDCSSDTQEQAEAFQIAARD